MNNHTFQAGAAEVEITPPLGTIINGDFVPHYAQTVHDPLYAKALVMSDGTTTIVLAIVDICAMGKAFLDAVKVRIHDQVGIAPQNVLIASTHTHAFTRKRIAKVFRY